MSGNDAITLPATVRVDMDTVEVFDSQNMGLLQGSLPSPTAKAGRMLLTCRPDVRSTVCGLNGEVRNAGSR